ncbi:MAG: alpha/beta fold hydrolase [Pseudomonadota bacterium]
MGLALVPVVTAAQVFWQERSYLHPAPRPLGMDLAAVGVAHLAPAVFPHPAGGTLRGWYAPSSNGAAVVLTHGAMGDRTGVVAETRILARAGFGVLAFDWPGHGESNGPVQWGAQERSALGSAVGWLATRPGVDPARIGVFGFSMGGYIVAQVAARDSRLRAVALAGTPSSATRLTDREYRGGGQLSQLMARWSDKLLFGPDDLPAERVVGGIAPRPLLIIAGGEDPAVQTDMAAELYRAAGEPKTLWIIPGAGHGGYAESDATYAHGLAAFFLRALPPARP